MYKKYKAPFLSDSPGAESKKLLIRNQDVQVVHGFDTVENAKGYRRRNTNYGAFIKPEEIHKTLAGSMPFIPSAGWAALRMSGP